MNVYKHILGLIVFLVCLVTFAGWITLSLIEKKLIGIEVISVIILIVLLFERLLLLKTLYYDKESSYEVQKLRISQLAYDVFQIIKRRLMWSVPPLHSWTCVLNSNISDYYRCFNFKTNTLAVCNFVRFRGHGEVDEIVYLLNLRYSMHPLLRFTYQDLARIFVNDLTPNEASYILSVEFCLIKNSVNSYASFLNFFLINFKVSLK